MRQGRRYPGALSALQGPVSSGTAIRGSPTGPQAWASRAFPYRHHCYEQELMVMVILAADPQWRRFPFEMSLSLSHRHRITTSTRASLVGRGAPARGVTS